MVELEQIEKDFRIIVHKITEIPEEKLEGDANFVDDLGIESIMAVDMVAAVEEKYGLQIPEERYGDFDCVDSVVELIYDLMEASDAV